jgi:hypothetical protein
MIKDIETKLERVEQSQLGMLIHLSTGGDALKIKKLSDLAKDISLENSVDCRVEDLEMFYNLDTPINKWDDIIDSEDITDMI